MLIVIKNKRMEKEREREIQKNLFQFSFLKIFTFLPRSSLFYVREERGKG